MTLMKTTSLLVTCILLCAPSAFAVDYYWDTNGTTPGAGTGNGTWDAGSGAFWNTDASGGAGGSFGTVPTGSDLAVLSAGNATGVAGTYVVGLGNSSVSALGLRYTSNVTGFLGSSVGDGTVTIGTGGLSASGGTSGFLTIRSNVNLNGSQTWTLTSGPPAGILTVSGAIGGTGNLTLTQNTGRAITLAGNVNHTGTILLNGANPGVTTISGNIGANVSNVTVSSAPILLLSGNNTYSGSTRVGSTNSQTTTLRIGSNSALASTTVVTLDTSVAASQARLELNNGANSFNATIAGLATSSTQRVGFAGVQNNASAAGTAVLTVNPTTNGTFAGFLRDGSTASLGLAVGGNSTFTLAGARNNYSAGTTVSSGTLAVTANAGTSLSLNVTTVATGTSTQCATVSSTTGLAIGQSVTAPNLAAGTYITGISGTTLFLSAFATAVGNNTASFAAYQTIGAGNVTATGTGVLDLSGSTTASVGAVNVTGGTIANGTLTGTSYTTTSGMVSANLAGSGVTLTKNGGGTTTLSGNNTYTGATTVNAGTLIVNGSLATGSSVSLGAATLAGSGGTVGGTVTTAGTSSIISPGLSPGNLTVGALDATSGAAFVFELGTSQDLLTISGTLTGSTAANGLVFNFSDSGGLLAGTPYTLITFASSTGLDYTDLLANTLPSGFLMDTSFGGGGNGFQINGGSLQAQFAVIPEPSTWALLAGGLTILTVFRRRRKGQ
jgi:autotransporter-associated beta strand protein